MKVLIVEDTKTITNLLQVYLMGWGLEFFDAPNGALGLTRARDMKPDLIISDVQMPEMDGFALCAAVRADPNAPRHALHDAHLAEGRREPAEGQAGGRQRVPQQARVRG